MTKDDTASLLKAVDEAQSSTRVRLRARRPELSMLVAAGSLAAAVGNRLNHRTVGEMLFVAAVLVFAAWRDARQRRHLGGRIDRIGWIATGLVLISGAACGLTLHGNAQDAAIGLCFSAGLLLLAIADRSIVLAAPVVVIVVAVCAGQGTVSSVLSFAAGLLCVFVVKTSQRRRKEVTK